MQMVIWKDALTLRIAACCRLLPEMCTCFGLLNTTSWIRLPEKWKAGKFLLPPAAEVFHFKR